MKRLAYVFSLLLVLSLSASVATQIPKWIQSSSPEDLSPFQLALQQGINQRKAEGLPVPSVQFEYQESSENALQQITSNPTKPVKFVGKTIIQFDGPEQAGYTEWPPLVTKENMPLEMQATAREEDYAEAYRQFMEEKIPGYWETYEFGHEPRTYTIIETIELTESQGNLLEADSRSMLPPVGAGAFLTNATAPLFILGNNALLAANASGQILTGFTYTGLRLDYIFENSLTATLVDTPEICIDIWPIPKFCIPATTVKVEVYKIKAGLGLDWALGLRLPASASLTGPDLLASGASTNNSVTSSLTPLDWSEANFTAAGVAPEGGNEFAFRFTFFIGLEVKLLEKDICEAAGLICKIDIDINESKSFTTPFGTGNFFPIEALTIPIHEFRAGLFSWTIGLDVTPKIGSKQISADWSASGAASGSGEIIYSEPGQTKSVGPINACASGASSTAQIQLSNFKYHFTEFLIDLGVSNKFAIDPIDVILPNGISWPPQPFPVGFPNPIHIAKFDLSPIFGGLGLSVGAHTECTWDFQCTAKGPSNKVNLSIPVVDQAAPTTMLTSSGTVGDNTWFRSDVQVNLSASDSPTGCNTGVKQTQYSLDGINWNTYTAPFTISKEGTNTVRFRSTDNSNNTELIKPQTIKIDKTPPSITGAPTNPANVYGWHNANVTVHFSASDTFSGIATVTSDMQFTSEGSNQSATGIAKDMAGNTASFTVNGINIDKTPPSISGARDRNPNGNGWYNADVTVNFICSDGLSGLLSCSSPSTLGEGANQNVVGNATDRAGNTAAFSVAGINIDKTQPSVSANPVPAANANGWNNTNVTVTYSGTDGLSGIAFCDTPAFLSNEGADQFASGSCSDLAGNNASATASGINIDKTPPLVDASVSPAANANGWNNTTVTVTYSGSDELSGIASCETDVLGNEGADQSASGSCTDLAGNSASATIGGINIDKTSPALNIISPEAVIFENTESFNILWSASDNISGVFTEVGSLDGRAVQNGELIELLTFSPGPHTLTVDVADKAGNPMNAFVVFNVSIDSKGLLALVEYMCDLGWINQPGICNSLGAKVNAAINSVERGNLIAAANQLNAFLNELEAQNGKSINQSAYDMLKTGALYVIDHLH